MSNLAVNAVLVILSNEPESWKMSNRLFYTPGLVLRCEKHNITIRCGRKEARLVTPAIELDWRQRVVLYKAVSVWFNWKLKEIFAMNKVDSQMAVWN